MLMCKNIQVQRKHCLDYFSPIKVSKPNIYYQMLKKWNDTNSQEIRHGGLYAVETLTKTKTERHSWKGKILV